MTLEDWIRGGQNPEYEREDYQQSRQVEPYRRPEPSSWSARDVERYRAYKAYERMEGALPLALRGVDTIKAIHDHINRMGRQHPALEAELRRVEEAVAMVVPYIIGQYMRGEDV